MVGVGGLRLRLVVAVEWSGRNTNLLAGGGEGRVSLGFAALDGRFVLTLAADWRSVHAVIY